ncbi:unnamed protein product [Ectocarpus sp. 4 AP-2014]
MSVDPDTVYIVHSKPKHDSHADAIRQFEGDFECLSNTYKCPVSLRGDPEPYPSVEHALQASKTDELELKAAIRLAKNAIEAKKIARAAKPKPDWRGSSEKIAEALVRDKFRRNAKAREVLVGTGRVKLVYTNTHDDRFWGVCTGKGENKLGKLLERVRADALAGKDTEAWCATRFQLALPLDVTVAFAVSKAGKIVADPSFEGKPVIRMGKLADNEVVMAHPSVSRSHALLVVDRSLGAFLVDLGASNGSFVDGRRISPYVPEPIKAGGAGLTFAKSKRTYTLTQVETDLREAKKGRLYASMSDPMASAAQPDPDSTVYVGNLDPSVTEDDIREFFAECGAIASVRIPQDKETGKMRGIAFVAFAKHSGVLQALTLHMDDLKGQSVKIRRADTAKPRDNGGAQHKKQVPNAPSSARPSPRAVQGAGGMGSGGGGGSASDPAMKKAIELATAAVIKAAEASKANAAAAAAADAAGGDGGQGAAKRQKTRDRFGEESATARNKRGNRWGDTQEEGGRGNGHSMPGRTAMSNAPGTAGADEAGARKSRGEGERRRDRRGGDKSVRDTGGRPRDDGGGGRRDGDRNDGRHRGDSRRRDGGESATGSDEDKGRREVTDDRSGGGGRGERRTHSDRNRGGGRSGRESRRSESFDRSGARGERRRRDDEHEHRREPRENGDGGGGGGGGGRSGRSRRDEHDRAGDRRVDGGRGGRVEDDGRRHRDVSREDGGSHRDTGGGGGDSRRKRGEEGSSRGRRKDRHNGDNHGTARPRPRSRSRGRR